MTAQLITTDKLQPGDKVEHRRNGDRFTVDSVTPARLDRRFHTPGAARSETGLEIVGHDADGETVHFTSAQSCQWWVIELASTTRKEPAMPELTATLIVSTLHSYCGHCRQNTLLRDSHGQPITHHTDISGYSPKPGGGCGARFVDITTDHLGVTLERLRELHPDLPVRITRA